MNHLFKKHFLEPNPHPSTPLISVNAFIISTVVFFKTLRHNYLLLRIYHISIPLKRDKYYYVTSALLMLISEKAFIDWLVHVHQSILYTIIDG